MQPPSPLHTFSVLLNYYFLKFIIRLSLLFAFVLTLPSGIFGQTYNFDFNERCAKAYSHIIAMRMEEAKSLLQQEKKVNPDNLIIHMIENYEDFLLLMMNGDANKYASQKKNFDKRISALEKGPSKSPWYNYTKANIYFQWATIQIRFGDYLAAGNNFRKSHILIKENRNKFPNFMYNNILYGVQEAIVGTVPDKYKWIANMLGLKGDVVEGVQKVVTFLNTKNESTKFLREEVIFYYTYLKFSLLSDQEYVWKYLKASKLDYEHNMLYAFMYANLSLTGNKADQAMDILNRRSKSADYPQLPLFDYMQGLSYFYQNDEKCIAYMKRFIAHYKGSLYIKHAYQIMSLYYFSEGNSALANTYKQQILKNGTETIDADRQAARYAKDNIEPNKELLKVRMAMDGGYFDKALQLISAINRYNLQSEANELEYLYRFGRINAFKNKTNDAITYFEQTIEKGNNRKEHYAARASLELGLLFEEKKQFTKAATYYRKCIEMKNHDYKSSIDQKAKAGLNRM